jgi:hypothetical protein
MAKHCIFEHFLSFVNQNRAKPLVIVTLQKQAKVRELFEASVALEKRVVLLQLTVLAIFGPREFRGYGKTLHI